MSTTEPPWVGSDTWYSLTGGADAAAAFFNVRTGTVCAELPDGMRDGVRRRSAPTDGPWAVPTVAAPPELPSELAPQCGVNSDDGMLLPEITSWGSSAMLFTAVHGVNLVRDEKPEHLPEDFTVYLARAWAARARARSVSWGLRALHWCEQHESPLPKARDPNYLTFEEASTNPWVVALDAVSPSQREVHVDVHGKADRVGEADLDVGVGALRAAYGDSAADEVADAVSRALREAVGPEYTVDSRPRLQGCWRSVPRRTLTQSSALLGYAVPLQCEIGYRLRRALGRDRALCARIADAFVAVAPTVAMTVARVRTLRVTHGFSV